MTTNASKHLTDLNPRWSGLGSTVVRLAVLSLFLSGCNMLDGFGGDSSRMDVKRDKNCTVRISQAALADGDDDSKVAETVRVDENCVVEIDFKQNVGDDADEAIEQ